MNTTALKSPTATPQWSGPARAWCYATAMIAVLAIVGCDRAKGREAVSEMCHKDGGLQVAYPTFVGGYLDLYAGSTCLACTYFVGKGLLDYVDLYSNGSGDVLFPHWVRSDQKMRRTEPEAGYYRVTAAEADDSRCGIYSAAVANRQAREPQYYGLKPNQCFAVEKLPSRPVGHVLNRQFRRVTAPNGMELGMDEFVLFDEQNKRVAGTVRNYVFTARTTFWLDMGGRGGRIDDDCRSTLGIERASSKSDLVVKTLRTR